MAEPFASTADVERARASGSTERAAEQRCANAADRSGADWSTASIVVEAAGMGLMALLGFLAEERNCQIRAEWMGVALFLGPMQVRISETFRCTAPLPATGSSVRCAPLLRAPPPRLHRAPPSPPPCLPGGPRPNQKLARMPSRPTKMLVFGPIPSPESPPTRLSPAQITTASPVPHPGPTLSAAHPGMQPLPRAAAAAAVAVEAAAATLSAIKEAATPSVLDRDPNGSTSIARIYLLLAVS